MSRIGVEIGGTFTDLVIADETGRLTTVKLASTPARPDQAAAAAVALAAPDLSVMDTIVHGSTIATNGVIERTGARVGLLVTAGFGDILQLQRQDRSEVYRLKYAPPVPLVARSDIAEVAERILADGTVLREPDPEQILAAAGPLVEAGITSVAVCLLHSYRHPVHELLVAEVLKAKWPEVSVTLSHEIAPEYREYERASTTVMSAYVRPIMDRYLSRFESALRTRGFAGDLHIMQSNGGVLPAALIRRHAVRTLLSGPAGGVTAAQAVVRELGISDIITFDMGGTSTDVCLIRGGRGEATAESDVDRLPVRVPMFDVITVGAGGGSIATVDAGGMLRVGPQSAGADPGPACYGRGGTQPTVTDANVVLGFIRPDRFLGGRMRLDRGTAQLACEHLGERLGTDALGAARAIIRLAVEGMLGALRLVSTERGVNPQGHWLLCYGGAGGQHAAALAVELGLPGVLVPRHPGLFSAYGLLIADLQRDWSAPFLRSTQDLRPDDLPTVVRQLQDSARQELSDVGQRGTDLTFLVSLAMRYPGQAFELEVAVADPELDAPGQIAARFHEQHQLRYGHAADGERPEIVAVHVRAVAHQPPLTPRVELPAADACPEWVELDVDGQRRPVAFFQRAELGRSQLVAGPAVVEEDASTIVVPPGWAARTTPSGHLLLERAPS